MIVEKQCKGCLEWKIKSEYKVGKSLKDEHILYCKKCRRLNTINSNVKSGTKEYLKNYNLLRRYGIDKESFDLLMISQNNKCAICDKTNDTNKEFFVDHNHSTGKVRAILCHSCNILISNCKENPEILNKAIDYLIIHNY